MTLTQTIDNNANYFRTDEQRSKILFNGERPMEGSFFTLGLEETCKYIYNDMTAEEKKIYDTAPTFYAATQSYYHKKLDGKTPLYYDLFRGAIKSAIAMVNGGADDFNSAAKNPGSPTPSILLAYKFAGAKKEIDYLLKCDPKIATNPEKDSAHRYAKAVEDANDVLYIYRILKKNGNGKLNQEAINAYLASPKGAKQDEHTDFRATLQQMDKLCEVKESERYKPVQKESKPQRGFFSRFLGHSK